MNRILKRVVVASALLSLGACVSDQRMKMRVEPTLPVPIMVVPDEGSHSYQNNHVQPYTPPPQYQSQPRYQPQPQYTPQPYDYPHHHDHDNRRENEHYRDDHDNRREKDYYRNERRREDGDNYRHDRH